MSDIVFYQRPWFRRMLVRLGFLLTFGILFWNEVRLFLVFTKISLVAIFSQPIPWLLNSDVRNHVVTVIAAAFDAQTERAIYILLINIFIYLILFISLLFWMAQFILPVQSLDHQFKAFDSIFRYLFGSHGLAIFVREGQLVGTKKELVGSLPGVALVDSSSAIVMESQSSDTTHSSDANDVNARKRSLWNIFLPKKKPKSSLVIRVEGPGLVFTDAGEKVRDTVDLRAQVRGRQEITGYTRDGIEFKADVSTVFSVSEPPEVVLVTYVGERKPENLRVVVFEKAPFKKIDGVAVPSPREDSESELQDNEQQISYEYPLFERVAALDDLGIVERNEIHSVFYARGGNAKLNDETLTNRKRTLYPFEPERIVLAVYNQPRAIDMEESVHWTELPPMVAVEVFRNMLTQYTFDDLYRREYSDEEKIPLKDFRRKFSLRVRSRGLMSFQYIGRLDGKTICEGDTKEELQVLPGVRQLSSSAELRNCGIKVIACGFSELKPVQKEVEQELFANWKAKWEKEIETTLAERDLEAARVRNRARTQVQSGSAQSLARIFDDTPFAYEAYVIRVFQALETAATDSSTSRLRPRDIINMLWGLYRWLLLDGSKSPDAEQEKDDGLPNSQNSNEDLS